MPASDGMRPLRLLRTEGIQQISTAASEIEPATDAGHHRLTDDERAAVEDGQAALDQLLQRLADTATPAGPTPRELGARPGRALPLFIEHSTEQSDRKQ
ncbi:hypothetical protein [Nocardia brasiliensis]|uniref:hypothetical protein n=1 Tax=Nocardia brasiliensis TaxID=37326 RepID=UPI00366D0569